jgi:predicted site-specific integrase-resolvase
VQDSKPTDRDLPTKDTKFAFTGMDHPLGRFMSRKEAAKFLNIMPQTLWSYEDKGIVVPYKNIVTGRVYYFENQILAVLGSKLPQSKAVVLYARTAVLGSKSKHGDSSPKRLHDQVSRMQDYCLKTGIRVDHVITDMGPGVGLKMLPGMDELIELIVRRKVSLLVVETADRLARWGMGPVFERWLTWHGVRLHVASPVLKRDEYVEEIKQDLTQVILESKKLLGELV